MPDLKPYGDVEYADPGYQEDGVHRYPIDTEKHVRAAWSYINMPKNQKAYTAAHIESIKTRIKSAAKKFGIEITANSAIPLHIGGEAVEMVIGQKNINFTDEPGGDTVFHGVTLMAEGVWTDSYSKMPNHYSAEEVAKMKVEKATLKMHHDISNSLPLTNEIGTIENMKLMQNPARWKGDVRIFPTANGKDVALLLKRGHFKGISPEMFRTPIYDKENNRIIAKDLSFMGAATVREGACSLCTFNEGDGTTAEKYTEEELKKVLEFLKSHPHMINKELDEIIDEIEKEEEKEEKASGKEEPGEIEEPGEGKESGAAMSALHSSGTKGDEKVNTGTPHGGGTPAGGATVELNDGQRAQIALLEQQLADAQKQGSAKIVAQLETLTKENDTLKKTVVELQKQAANAEAVARIRQLEADLKAANSQPVIYTKMPSAQASGSAVELDQTYEPFSVRDFGD